MAPQSSQSSEMRGSHPPSLRVPTRRHREGEVVQNSSGPSMPVPLNSRTINPNEYKAVSV